MRTYDAEDHIAWDKQDVLSTDPAVKRRLRQGDRLIKEAKRKIFRKVKVISDARGYMTPMEFSDLCDQTATKICSRDHNLQLAVLPLMQVVQKMSLDEFIVNGWDECTSIDKQNEVLVGIVLNDHNAVLLKILPETVYVPTLVLIGYNSTTPESLFTPTPIKPRTPPKSLDDDVVKPTEQQTE